MKRNKRVFIAIGVILSTASWLGADWWSALPAGKTGQFVGRQTCVECHQKEGRQWTGSDHDLAMDLATPEFVLGDFDNTQLEHHGITSKMSHKGGQYFVETEGPDGELAKFHVDYVFGVRPLQQYLTKLDRGRYQVLPVTWDTEGERWFYANPDAPFGPDDPLHWTGSAQNWNHMCADCHTTNFAKNYDLKTHTHHHTYSEMDVSCEACHGPGSIHVEIAESNSIFWDRRYGHGLAELEHENSKIQLESCAPCHSHRRRLYPGFQPGDEFLDHYGLSLVEEHLYHDDGQIDEEVYVYGSFLQSLMYRKGVRCTNCHDPHTTRVKSQGNALCTQCHNAAKFDNQKHHHHEFGTKGALCVECHMPSKKYMVVDPRRDHSIRVPRPDLTVKLGTPNACNNCHTKPKETAQWAANQVVKWYGTKRLKKPHYGEILAAGRTGSSRAERQLIGLMTSQDVGPTVRATAVSVLATRYQSRDTERAIREALTSSEPLMRAAALRAFEGRNPESPQQVSALKSAVAPLLDDPVRLVRTEAARVLAQIPTSVLKKSERIQFNSVLEEYVTGLLTEGDQSGVHMSLGVLYDQLGKTDSAIKGLETAIQLEPTATGARSNLAQIFERQGRTEDVLKLRAEEVELMKRNARLLPDNARIHYQLGLMLYLSKREQEAVASLSKAVELEPNSSNYLLTLTLLYEKLQQWPKALASARRLVQGEPQNAMFRQVLLKIETAASQAPKPIGPRKSTGQ